MFKFLPKYPLKHLKMFLMSSFCSHDNILGMSCLQHTAYTLSISLGVRIPFSWPFSTLLRSSLASLIHSVWALHFIHSACSQLLHLYLKYLLHSSHGLSSSLSLTLYNRWLVLCSAVQLHLAPLVMLKEESCDAASQQLWVSILSLASLGKAHSLLLHSALSSPPQNDSIYRFIPDASPRVWRNMPEAK